MLPHLYHTLVKYAMSLDHVGQLAIGMRRVPSTQFASKSASRSRNHFRPNYRGYSISSSPGSQSCSLSTKSRAKMSEAWKEFIKPNEEYTAVFGSKGSLPLPPAKKLAIVSCMDARINVYAELGISEGDSHIIRNAGGSAKDALRSLIISQRLLGTREIAVFHHTDCGMLTFKSHELRELVKKSDPGNKALETVDSIDFLEFPELEQSVKDDVQFLKDNPLILPETIVTGWVYDVRTGKIKQIV